MGNFQQDFKLLLNRTTSPFALYALAFVPTTGDYWVGGTRYGANEGPNLATYAEAGRSGPVDTYVTDATGGTLTTAAGSDTNSANILLTHTATMVIGQRYRIKGRLITSNRGSFSIDSGGFAINRGGAGATDFDQIITCPGTYSFNLRLSSSDGGGFAPPGSTVRIENLTVTRVADVSQMPGYSYSRSGEQGAVKADGTVEWFPANVPAINDRGYHAYGALTNAITDSRPENWTLFGSATRGAINKSAPDGSLTAVELTLPAGSPGVNQLYRATTIPVGWNTLGLFVRSRTGGTQKFKLKIQDPSDIFGPDLTATPAWAFFAFPYQVATGGAGLSPAITNASDGSAASLEVWQGQLLNGNFPDGGPLIRTTSAAASIGASNLLANSPVSTDQDFIAIVVCNLPPVTTTHDDVLAQLGNDATLTNRITFARSNTSGALAVNCAGGGGSRAVGVSTPGAARVALLYRRRGGKDTAAAKVGEAVTVGAESGATGFPPINAKLLAGYIAGASGNEPNGAIENIAIRIGTFSDADVSAILGAA